MRAARYTLGAEPFATPAGEAGLAEYAAIDDLARIAEEPEVTPEGLAAGTLAASAFAMA